MSNFKVGTPRDANILFGIPYSSFLINVRLLIVELLAL